MNTDTIFTKQREFFRSGKTVDISFRRDMLKKLYSAIKERESDILAALKTDLGKSDFEAFMCEIGMALSEISYLIKNLRKLSSKRRVPTPLAQFYSRSFQQATPYGNVLIMSPWNYPFLLTVGPLADAIAAGNTAIVKPSAYSPAVSDVLESIIAENFPIEYISVVKGGRQENAHLLEMDFDFIFFTGSQAVGKEVLRHAAEKLIPVVLELGGKSPCIVDKSADIKLAARRIVFGKYLNCGQTCVAPDFILCQRDIKDEFIAAVKEEIVAQYGENPLDCKDYGKIINEKHFRRIIKLMDSDHIVHGGRYDESSLRIEPTVMDNVDFGMAVMQEEIFGPLMPIICFDDFDSIFDILSEREKPLALYLFSTDKKHINAVTTRCLYGGGCINDTIIHLATSYMGFGGVHESGMGSYHGKDGFDAFSHIKSIVDKKNIIDLPMRYRPYKKFYSKLLRLFLK